MKKCISTILMLAASGVFFFANAQSDSSKRYMISQVPQYFLVNGIRVDYDRRIGNTNQWLVFGPQIYGATKQNRTDFADDLDRYDYYGNNSDYRYDRMFGFGLDFYHKSFVENTNLPSGVYVAFGPMAQYFNIDLKKTEFIKGTDGYYDESVKNVNESILKLGANFIFGLQDEIVENLIGDIYLGVGYRNSIYLNGNYEDSKFTNFLGYGYTGVTLVAGFRVGLMFPSN